MKNVHKIVRSIYDQHYRLSGRTIRRFVETFPETGSMEDQITAKYDRGGCPQENIYMLHASVVEEAKDI